MSPAITGKKCKEEEERDLLENDEMQYFDEIDQNLIVDVIEIMQVDCTEWTQFQKINTQYRAKKVG